MTIFSATLIIGSGFDVQKFSCQCQWTQQSLAVDIWTRQFCKLKISAKIYSLAEWCGTLSGIMWQSIKKSFYPVEQRAVQLDFPEQLPISSLHHSDVYSRSFGNTSNLIPSLLQHPSVYLLINQLRALFADQESPAAKFASSVHTLLALTITCLTLGGCTIRIFTASKKVQTIKKSLQLLSDLDHVSPWLLLVVWWLPWWPELLHVKLDNHQLPQM